MRKIFILSAIIFLLAGISFGAITVKPPLDFKNVPIKSALDTIFLKAGNMPFEIDKDIKFDPKQTVTMTIASETSLDVVLKTVLDPKGFMFEADGKGIYHIRKKGAPPRKADLNTLSVVAVVQNTVAVMCENNAYYASVGQVFKARDKSTIPGYPYLKLDKVDVKKNIVVLKDGDKTYEITIKKIAVTKPKPPAKQQEKPVKK